MLKRIGLLTLLLMFILGTSCFAYNIENIELNMDKDTVIEKMLEKNYALIEQVDKNGNLNLLFKNNKRVSVVIEFNNNQVISIDKKYSADVTSYIKRTEEISKTNDTLITIQDSKLVTLVSLEGEIRDQLTKVKPSLEKNDHFKNDIPNKPLKMSNFSTKGHRNVRF